MPITVSDSSTLIHLAGIGRLDLLRQFYDTLLIPPAVHREVITEGGIRPPALLAAQAVSDGWIQVATEPLPEAVTLQKDGKLDPGESEAIALLLARGSDGILLMDEAHGRSVAKQRGLKITGLVGVLLRAKQDGLILSLKEELDKLRRGTGFYLHPQLVQQVLTLAGE